jgi:membrane protease YdiL (CAAX protease family)
MSDVSSKKPRGSEPAKAKAFAWGPLAAIVVVFASYLFIPLLAQLQVSLYPTLLGWDDVAANDWLQSSTTASFMYVFLTESITIAALFWFTSYKHVAFRVATALGKPKWRDLAYAFAGFGVYFLLFLAVMMFAQFIPALDVDQEQSLGFDTGISGANLAMAFASLVILPPLVEEIVFRGFFYGTLRANKVRKWTAIVLTSLLFGSLHLFGAAEGGLLWIAFIDTFLLSVVMCYLRERNGSIWASIGVHALKNCFVFVNLFVISAA